MDHATLVTTAAFLCGGTAGALALGFIAAVKHDRLQKLIKAKDEAIIERDQLVSDLTGEASQLGNRCSELRTANREKDQANDKLVRRIAELEPLAEEGRKIRDQRAANLAKMQAVNRARAAAKASNVAPIKRRA